MGSINASHSLYNAYTHLAAGLVMWHLHGTLDISAHKPRFTVLQWIQSRTHTMSFAVVRQTTRNKS